MTRGPRLSVAGLVLLLFLLKYDPSGRFQPLESVPHDDWQRQVVGRCSGFQVECF